jgi:predicted ATPase/DNA-binding winged helix-turn-helix (wHTH) protein
MPGSIRNLVFTCGPWEVDLGRRELRSRGAPVALGNRAFEIVEVLARAAGQLVTKDALMERIWPGAIVGDNTLHVHIAAVRKAFGSDRGMLQTAPGRGYRLVGGWVGQAGEATELPSSSPPPARALPAERPAINFPVVVTRLVGRSTAVQRVRDLVSAYRVVTLTGPGGIGKTALALKTVRDLLPDFEDGAWLVELASLSDPALTPSAVAGVLGLKLGGDRVTAEALARGIGDRHLLLLLDNCEHLIDSVAVLTEAVMSLCPRVTVLATSREIMRIQGESVYRVPALDVPAAGQEAPDFILDHSAVELFVTRAKALDAGFVPQPEDIRSIAEICRHLDGIPLAIEFAAAQAALVGTEQVATGLRDRFALLTSGRRTTIPRHRTLRAALDWSYGLLPPEEQRLLHHLAVFPAGFTFEAAEAVGGRAGHSVVDELSSLVSKSLCERVSSTSLTRWRLLETIRAYALEKLTENGEYPDAARQHAAYFRDLISRVTADSTVWLSRDDVARCASELDNVRAALDWTFSPAGDAEIGVGLTIAFAPIWQTLSLMGECRERVERMLAIGPPGTDLSQAAAMRMWIAYSEALTMTFAPFGRAYDAFKKVMGLAANVDDVELQAGLLYMQWSLEFMSGDQGAALNSARRLTAITPRGGDIMRLTADRILGASLLSAGKLSDAQDCLQRVVDFHGTPSGGHHSPLFRRDPHVLARVRLARVLSLRGYLDRAYAEARTGFEMAQSSGAGITVCWAVHDALSPIALTMGDLDAAEAATAAMNDWAMRIDAGLWKVMATCWKGRLLLERGEVVQGTELISQALGACEQTGWQMGYVQFLGWAADGLTRLGRFDEAGAKLERAIAWADHQGESWYRPELMRMKGDLLLQQSHAGEAEACLRTAAEIARDQGALYWELRVALGLARLRIGQGRGDEVRSLLAPVYDRFTEGFGAPDLRAAKALLGG